MTESVFSHRDLSVYRILQEAELLNRLSRVPEFQERYYRHSRRKPGYLPSKYVKERAYDARADLRQLRPCLKKMDIGEMMEWVRTDTPSSKTETLENTESPQESVEAPQQEQEAPHEPVEAPQQEQEAPHEPVEIPPENTTEAQPLLVHDDTDDLGFCSAVVSANNTTTPSACSCSDLDLDELANILRSSQEESGDVIEEVKAERNGSPSNNSEASTAHLDRPETAFDGPLKPRVLSTTTQPLIPLQLRTCSRL